MMFKIYPSSRHELHGCSAIYRYCMGGRGVVTLESPSGKSHTYVFKKPKENDVFPEDVVFIYALHNGEKLYYVGMIEDGKFRTTSASRFLRDTEIVRGAEYINKMMHFDFSTPMKLYHEGVCSRCGRELTSEASLKTGIGPKCSKRV